MSPNVLVVSLVACLFVLPFSYGCQDPEEEALSKFCSQPPSNRCTHTAYWSSVLKNTERMIEDFNVEKDELAIACHATEFQPIWKLSTKEEYDSCEAKSPNSFIIGNCTPCSGMIKRQYFYFKTSVFGVDRILVEPGEDVYLAALGVDRTPSLCGSNGVKLTINIAGEKPSPTIAPTNSTPSIGELGSSSLRSTTSVLALLVTSLCVLLCL